MSHPILGVFPTSVLDALRDLERRLADQAASRDARLHGWTLEPLAAGGKRIRPLLVLTAFEACAGAQPTAAARSQALDAAVALELVHTASLVHDDIMDESAERRGRPSTYAAHGRDGAILVGDYLFTQAFALAATLPKEAMAMTADACRRLCEGQMAEAGLRSKAACLLGKNEDAASTVAEVRFAYLGVIRDKTAALLAAGCGIGATMAGADQAAVQALYRYGDAIGHAFQVLDDVLDVTGDPAWTGKPAGGDYLASTWSSPYLHFHERGGRLPARRQGADFPEVRRQLFATGAVAASQLEASGYTQAALLEAERLPASPARDALVRLAELLMERAT